MDETTNKYECLIQITKLSEKKQKSLFYWIGKQNILILIEIMKEQRNQFFKLKNKGYDSDIIPVASLLLAIKKYHDDLNLNNKKNNSNNLDEIGKVSEIRSKQMAKPRIKPKYEALLDRQEQVLKHYIMGFRSRKIAKLLETKDFKVSHTTVDKFLKEFYLGK